MKQIYSFQQNQKNILNNGVSLFKKQIEENNVQLQPQQGQQLNQNRGRNLLNLKQNLPQFSKKFLSQSIDQETNQINQAFGSQIRKIYKKNRCVRQLSQDELDTNSRFVLGSSIDRSNLNQHQFQQQNLKNELFVSNRAFHPQSTSSQYKSQSPQFQQAQRTAKGLTLYQNDDSQTEHDNFFGDISIEISSKYQQFTSKSNIQNKPNNTKQRFMIYQNQTPQQNKQLTKLTEQDSSQFTLVSIEQLNQKIVQDTQNPLKFNASNPFVQKNSKNSKRYDANINVNEAKIEKSSNFIYSKSKSPNSFISLQKDQSFSLQKNSKLDQSLTKSFENNQNGLHYLKNEYITEDGLHSLKNYLNNSQIDKQKTNNYEQQQNKIQFNNRVHGSIESIDIKQQTNQKEHSQSSQSRSKQHSNNNNKGSQSKQSDQSTIMSIAEQLQRQKDFESQSEKKYQLMVLKMKECFEKFQKTYKQINKPSSENDIKQKSQTNLQNQYSDNQQINFNSDQEIQQFKNSDSQNSKVKQGQMNKKLCNVGLNMIHRLFIKKYGQILLTQLKIEKHIHNYSLKLNQN